MNLIPPVFTRNQGSSKQLRWPNRWRVPRRGGRISTWIILYIQLCILENIIETGWSAHRWPVRGNYYIWLTHVNSIVNVGKYTTVHWMPGMVTQIQTNTKAWRKNRASNMWWTFIDMLTHSPQGSWNMAPTQRMHHLSGKSLESNDRFDSSLIPQNLGL